MCKRATYFAHCWSTKVIPKFNSIHEIPLFRWPSWISRCLIYAVIVTDRLTHFHIELSERFFPGVFNFMWARWTTDVGSLDFWFCCDVKSESAGNYFWELQKSWISVFSLQFSVQACELFLFLTVYDSIQVHSIYTFNSTATSKCKMLQRPLMFMRDNHGLNFCCFNVWSIRNLKLPHHQLGKRLGIELCKSCAEKRNQKSAEIINKPAPDTRTSPNDSSTFNF